MIEIEESGVVFGPFDTNSLYQIEESQHLPRHVKPVEFAWVPPNGRYLILIEAKSSFSNPANEIDFERNVQEIYKKMVDSLTVLASAKLGRHPGIETELPEKLAQIDWSNVQIQMRLVIPNFHNDWLPPISDIIRKRLKHFLASLKVSEINFQVLNQEMASAQGLLRD